MKITKILVPIIMILCLVIPNTSVGFSSITNDEADLAMNSARLFVNKITVGNEDLSGWVSAKLCFQKLFHEIGTKRSVFVFSLTTAGVVIGHITVGDATFGYKVVEAGAAALPRDPTVDEIIKSTNNLGNYGFTTVDKPIEYVYSGIGLEGLFAVYEIHGKYIAINLVSKKAFELACLGSNVPNERQYLSTNRDTVVSRPEYLLDSGDYYLNISVYNYGYCGPASGVSIGRYYRDVRGYNYLYSNSWMYSTLYNLMYCDYYGGATMPSDYGPGFRGMAENCGYYNFSYENDWFVSGGDYWTVTGHIDSGWPTALCRTSDWHWRAIKGYLWEGAPYNWHYIICTNSATNDSWEYLDWDNLGFAYLFTTCIED